MRSPSVEQILQSEAFEFGYLADAPLTDFDFKMSQRNQARAHPILDDAVDLYALMLADNSEAPAVVAYRGTNGLVLIDGNQRLTAARKVGRQTIDCYLVVDSDHQKLDILTQTINWRLNGRTEPEAERMAMAKRYIRQYPNVPIKEVARQFLIKADVLERALRAAKTITRIESSGLDATGLSGSVVNQMHSIQSDPVLHDTAMLIKEAGLRGEDANLLINDVKQARSEREAIAAIDRWRAKPEVREAIIRTVTGRTHIPKPQRKTLFDKLNSAIRLLEGADDLAALQINTNEDVETLAVRTEHLLSLVRTLIESRRKAAA